MKIAHVNTTDIKGGAGLNTYRLHKSLLKNGDRSTFFVGKKYSDDNSVVEIKGRIDVPIINTAIKVLGVRDLISYKSDLFINREYLDADIVNINNIHGGYWKLSQLHRLTSEKKVVWTFHDMWPILGNKYHDINIDNNSILPSVINKKIDSLLLKSKQNVYSNSLFHIVVPSLWLQRKVNQSILRDFPCTHIPNGIDTDHIYPMNKKDLLRRKYGIPYDFRVISFISDGGLSNPWKGGEYIRKSLELIMKDFNVVFLEIGAKVSEVVKDGLHWKIPPVEDRSVLNELLNASDLFIFTSIAENFPLVLLEAQAAGIPVVSFDVGGAKEIVVDGETGFIGRYKSVSDIVKNVSVILKDMGLSARMGKLASSRISKMFSINKMTDNYRELYNKIISKPNE